MAAHNSEVLLTIVNELLEDSSSSSDDEEFIKMLLKKKRSKKHRIGNYLDVVYSYSQDEFKKHFRLSKTSYELLLNTFNNSAQYVSYSKQDHGGSPRLGSDVHILCFLWFASNKCVLRDVSERFNIGESTLQRAIDRVMEFLVDIAKTIIRFPSTEEEKSKNAVEFHKISGFPNVIGCIDGTAIPIRTPKHKLKSTYCNRHDMPSITLQGICDAKLRFMDVFTGPPGKIHDSRVLKLSFIGKKISDICGQHHLLGDGAYAVREYLITPYRDFGLPVDCLNFNRKLSATRVKIENCFGLLKSRFRQLMRLDFHTVDKMSKFIISCCVIHNICIDNNDLLSIDHFNENVQYAEVDETERQIHLRRLGEIKRDALCEILNQATQHSN